MTRPFEGGQEDAVDKAVDQFRTAYEVATKLYARKGHQQVYFEGAPPRLRSPRVAISRPPRGAGMTCMASGVEEVPLEQFSVF